MRPGDQAVALLFLMEYDRRRWQDARFREAYNARRQAAASTPPDELEGMAQDVGGHGEAPDPRGCPDPRQHGRQHRSPGRW